MYNKKNGVYYTPTSLAEFLVKPFSFSEGDKVFDPSYGEGSLLLAVEKTKMKSLNLELFGCDTKPVNGLLDHLPKANLKEVDFFDFSLDNKFKTILLNPPYVRRHFQNLEKIKIYRSRIPELEMLNNSSDLWAFFLIKSALHLSAGGNIGAILPWAFLQADYAKPVRSWLALNFSSIKIVALSNKFFLEADERIVILWLKGFGRKCRSVLIGSSPSLSSRIIFSKLPLDLWNSDRVNSFGSFDHNKFNLELKKEGFCKLSEYADVKIGIVCGAVKYFVLDPAKAAQHGFTSKNLVRVLKSSDEFTEYLKNKTDFLNVMLKLEKQDHDIFSNYIKMGVEKNIHLRAHSQFRNPWYAVKFGAVPDAFFHYRVGMIPFLVPNNSKVQSTNSIHRVYFRGLSETEKKWLFVSILSSLSQLSVELNSKTYGRGILKIEPKSLKDTLVLIRSDDSIQPIYDEIISLLSKNNKIEASSIATKFICSKTNFSPDFISSIDETLNKSRQMRLTNV